MLSRGVSQEVFYLELDVVNCSNDASLGTC
jgi:hypothetical protein